MVPGLDNATERRLSVVIVSHNEGAYLRQTVDGMLATSPADTEVVVVDDQSTDGSADFLVGVNGRVRLLRPRDRLGISRGRNLGGRAATGDVIVFSDAHVDTRPGWSEPLYAAAQKPSVGEVGPAVGLLGTPHMKGYGFTWRDASLKMHWLDKQGDTPYAVPFLCGCFVAMRRDVFDSIGGFDEGLIRWGSEDAELSLRLWRLGYECHVVPGSHVGHLFRKRFPYDVRWDTTLHNTLRLAAIHFGQRALSRVIDHYRTQAGFARAFSLLVDGDVWQRRETMLSAAVRDVGWLGARFGLEAIT
jgi:GT2 family glycosyltransferase